MNLVKKFAVVTVLLSSLSALATDRGLVFNCGVARSFQVQDLSVAVDAYLTENAISSEWYSKSIDAERGVLVYRVQDRNSLRGTLDFHEAAEYDRMPRDALEMPIKGGGVKVVPVTSKKEILMSLMHDGRVTEFKDRACDVQALKDQVGVRQNIVMWSSFLAWIWPNGEKARWNAEYWDRGDLRDPAQVKLAFDDFFFEPQKYAVGCYTATKIIVVQALLDYFSRVSPDQVKYDLVVSRLLKDGDPLVGVEPRRFWAFEPDFDATDVHLEGKLLKMDLGVSMRNFIPGDWAYMWNTDPVSYQHIGYEGSNAIYLGRNLFDDYYDDNGGAYKYQRKLDEVYQWSNGVFSRSRDSAKLKPTTPAQIEAYGDTPERGGFILDSRLVPYQFGYETLPEVDWQ